MELDDAVIGELGGGGCEPVLDEGRLTRLPLLHHRLHNLAVPPPSRLPSRGPGSGQRHLVVGAGADEAGDLRVRGRVQNPAVVQGDSQKVEHDALFRVLELFNPSIPTVGRGKVAEECVWEEVTR